MLIFSFFSYTTANVFQSKEKTVLYNKIIWSIVFIFASCRSMTFHVDPGQKPQRFLHGSIEIRICKELYPFYACRVSSLAGVKQVYYDEATCGAFCQLSYPVDSESILEQDAFLALLGKNCKPGRHQKNHLKFVLNAFVELEKILDTKVFIFNPQKNGVILNPRFKNIDCPYLIEYFSSIESPLHACACIARVPVAKYRT